MIPAWILLCTIGGFLAVLGLMFFLIYRRLPRRILIRDVTPEELDEEREEEKKPRWHIELAMNTVEYHGHTFDPVNEIFPVVAGGLFSVILQQGLPIDLEELQLTAEIRLYDGCKYLDQNAWFFDRAEMARFRDVLFNKLNELGQKTIRDIMPQVFAAQRPVAVAAVADPEQAEGLLGIEDLKKLD